MQPIHVIHGLHGFSQRFVVRVWDKDHLVLQLFSAIVDVFASQPCQREGTTE